MLQTKKGSIKPASRSKRKINPDDLKEQKIRVSRNEVKLLFHPIQTKVEMKLSEICLNFPRNLLDKTLTELRNLPYNNESDSTDLKSSISKSILKSTRRKRKISHSYSIESSPNSITTYESSKMKVSRLRSSSLSRHRRGTAENFIKPICSSKSYNNIGIVTPKIKSNTAQVILRKPKQGETAISMQGSPLMVGGIVYDDTANVNIPLGDGRVLSIQPKKGLHMFSLPSLDEETRRQIKTLCDNLKAVCKTMKK